MVNDDLLAEMFAMDLDDYDGITGDSMFFGQSARLIINYKDTGMSYVLIEETDGFREAEEYDSPKDAKDAFAAIKEEYLDFLMN